MGRPFRLPFGDCTGGHRYFLTVCTHNRQRHFADAATVEATRLQFLRYAERESFAILAYCFMPDHVHCLLEGQHADANLRRFVRAAKQGAGYAFAQRCGNRLWQPNYFDHTLRHDEATIEVVRYLLNNPVRAGLVESLDAYPHWGSGVCTREELLETLV